MGRDTQGKSEAQPIRASIRRIMSYLIANANTPAERKAMVLTAYEVGALSCAEMLYRIGHMPVD